MEKLLISGFVAVESAHAFSAFCPSIFTIKTFADTEDKKQAIRFGYVPAIVFSLVLAFVCSKIIRSWAPLWLAVFTDVFMVVNYEVSMR
jgi:predicted tellurium resistance membrane protein TerC